MSDYYSIEPVSVDPMGIGYDMAEVTSTPQLEWWPGDDFVQSEKGYLITEKLKTLLDEHELSGYSTSEIMVEKTDKIEEELPDISLPKFHLLEIGRVPNSSRVVTDSCGNRVTSGIHPEVTHARHNRRASHG